MGLIYVTDWSITGSGYFSIGASLVPALTEGREEDIIVLGINYFGQEYSQTAYTVVPTQFEHVPARIKHILKDESLDFDKVVVALDIPMHERLLAQFPRKDRPFRYTGIFPLDGGPLVREWAMIAGEMNEAFVLSKFAQKCCRDAGLDVHYLPVGVSAWFPHAEEGFRKECRETHGVDGKFIILNIGDNHERKNHAGAMQMVAEFYKRHPNTEYWVVTRMDGRFGWQMESLASDLGIRKITHFFDRTLKPNVLFLFQCCADVLLHTSKAEGLGLPVLEAQMVGSAIPIVTRTPSLIELIEEGGGLFIEPEFGFIDPFGNTKRVFPSIIDGVKKLEMIYNAPESSLEWMRHFGRIAIGNRTWDKAARVFWDALDRERLGTVGARSHAPWYSAGYKLEVPEYKYDLEHIGR